MYTSSMFGQDLKKYLASDNSLKKLRDWALSVYFENKNEIDPEFKKIFITFGKMEEGVDVWFSREEINKIADDLILGNSVDLAEEITKKEIMRRQIEFAQELKKKVGAKQDRYDLGHWAFSIFLDIKSDFGSILYAIATMESDPQFWYSYEDLDQIADELLTGKPLDWEDFDKRKKVDSEEVAE
jgi:hypothetical protein